MATNAQWQELTSPIETHVGLQFGANIKDLINVDSIVYAYRQIALFDITKGADTDVRKAFDNYYEVDGERLHTVAKYGKTSNKVQCYTGKNRINDDATLYYNNSGKIMVKDSDRVVVADGAQASTFQKTDIFASLKR